MATHISSETLDPGRTATQANTSTDLKISINNVDYKIEIVLYKKGQKKEDGFLINTSYINSIIFLDNLFDVFPRLIINYEDKESNDIPFDFSYDSSDRVYVYLSKIQEEKSDVAPYPLVDDDFIIFNNSNGQIGNANDNTKFFAKSLTLLPVAWHNLITSHPQWSTGFDTDYAEKSGKEVGECLKEILKIAGCETDDPIFDKGKSIINYTSLIGQNALQTMMAIYPYFVPTDGSGSCVLKYNPVTHKFSLQSLSTFFKHKDLDDEIKSYLTIPLKQFYDENSEVTFESMLGTMLSRILNKQTVNDPLDYSHNIVHEIKSMSDISDKTIRVTRAKGTFLIDSQEMNLEETNKTIRKIFRDNDVNFGQSPNDLVKKDEIIKRDIVFTPHYRAKERDALNIQSLKALLTASNFSATVPWFGGEIQTGRKFAVKISQGATTEELKKKVGTYMIINVSQAISPRNGTVETNILGVNIIKSRAGTYHL